jgi:hypothetical protein
MKIDSNIVTPAIRWRELHPGSYRVSYGDAHGECPSFFGG